MTCGAAGALNVILKTLLDPGDEVICPGALFSSNIIFMPPIMGAY